MQLKLFERNIILSANLIADSKKTAFYRLYLVFENGVYSVEKESGAAGRVLDRRKWPCKSYDEAKKLYDRKLKSKINPNRKSERHYKKT